MLDVFHPSEVALLRKLSEAPWIGLRFAAGRREVDAMRRWSALISVPQKLQLSVTLCQRFSPSLRHVPFQAPFLLHAFLEMPEREHASYFPRIRFLQG